MHLSETRKKRERERDWLTDGAPFMGHISWGWARSRLGPGNWELHLGFKLKPTSCWMLGEYYPWADFTASKKITTDCLDAFDTSVWNLHLITCVEPLTQNLAIMVAKQMRAIMICPEHCGVMSWWQLPSIPQSPAQQLTRTHSKWDILNRMPINWDLRNRIEKDQIGLSWTRAMNSTTVQIESLIPLGKKRASPLLLMI